MSAHQHFRVRSELARHSGKWRIERKRDGKVMTQNSSIFVCFKWLRAWGTSPSRW